MLTAQDYLKLIRATPMTQEEVARRTGIPQGTISKLERGKVEDVLSKTYLALKALHDELYPQQPEPCTSSAKWGGKERRKEARG